MRKTIIRFLKYFLVGFSTFLFDLLLLYLFTDFLHLNYLLSVAVAYFIAVSINYYVSRRFVFSKTLERVDKGYVNFILIGSIGLLFVVLLMAFFVETLNIEYVISRIIVAAIVGFWNYLMNLYVNFKVSGNH